MAAPLSESSVKLSSPPLFILICSLLIISTTTQLQSHDEEGFISVLVSDKGLEFAKDLVISKALNSMLPLQLPHIRKSVRVPVVGEVDVLLSNIMIASVGIQSSYVKTGEEGIALIVSGATANLSLNWEYSYSSWFIPFPISERGSASVKVEGMEVGLTSTLTNQGGTLKLALLDCGCYVEAISIKLDGGSPWLYQIAVAAFEGQIATTVEKAIPEKISEGITILDAKLQDLPRYMPVGEAAVLNVTFVKDPALSDSSIDLEIDGLFTTSDHNIAFLEKSPNLSLSSSSCNGMVKMIQISLHENVLKSASSVYFNAGYMNLIVDKMPDQKLLNTAGWKYTVPQLYKQYPDDDMQLNISASSLPMIEVSDSGIYTTLYSDVTIDVLDSGDVVPVACISLVSETLLILCDVYTSILLGIDIVFNR
ncbi:hypothetical protein SAY86_003930 [Trapa natans]|uniref:Lipid-binding serum glycoprotein N-terminal domain-containing protein n=1 Tax=Trapa natans TaxID=22666 RepID=A0AAN7N588_TRANT|nr:hypothetical protein SAY86_003930 [Trapa natans]